MSCCLNTYFPINQPFESSKVGKIVHFLEKASERILRVATDCLALVAALFLCLTVVALPLAYRSIQKGEPVVYRNRLTGKREIEKVYGETLLRFLYGESLISQIIGAPFLHLLVRFPIFSAAFGLYQKSSWSQKNIAPFINNFSIDTTEFQDNPSSFTSFNDFFTHKLKPQARPIAAGKNVAIMPADGRYRFYQNIRIRDGFQVKGQDFNLAKLVHDKALARKYDHGTMVLARLCPTDYHRFHFPVDCRAKVSRIVNGWLFSVNPIAESWAIKHNINIFTENKRSLCKLHSPTFGTVLCMEIGATTIGSINQTYTPNSLQKKGAEKGYFSFGASAMILLFQKGSITLAPDLLRFQPDEEIECKMGQILGTKSA